MGRRLRRKLADRIELFMDGDPVVTREELARWGRWKAFGGEPPLLARLQDALGIPEDELRAAIRTDIVEGGLA